MTQSRDSAFDVAYPYLLGLVAGFVLALALTAGCVTRAQVCVEHARGVGPETPTGRRDSVGASACVDVEPRQ